MAMQSDYVIKRIDSSYKEKVLDHFLRLDDNIIYDRFRTPAKKEYLETYVNKLDFENDGMFAIFDTNLNIIGFGECFIEKNGKHAEIGFSIEPEHQGLGLGSKLMGRLVRFAKSQDKNILEMSCLRSNKKSIALAQKFGLKIQFDGSESYALINMEGIKPEVENLNEKVEDTFAFYILRQKQQINNFKEGQKFINETFNKVISSTMEVIRPKFK